MASTTSTSPVSVALLGAGIFASEEYIPAINGSTLLSLKAVYSRSQKSAEALTKLSKTTPEIYYDSPATPGKSLDDLLKRTDIDAVLVCLPIPVQPSVIKKAWAAGKHVISEKPIAKDVATALDLIKTHQALEKPLIWSVAENFRLLEPFVFANSKLKELGGELISFGANMSTLVKVEDKYFQTPWRTVPEYQGGFLLDGGIHFVAGLRFMLNAIGEDVSHVVGTTRLLQKMLPPVDTITSIWTTTGTKSSPDGKTGPFGLSFGNPFKGAAEMEVTTSSGRVHVNFASPKPTVTVTTLNGEGKKQVEEHEFPSSSGVDIELDVFASSVVAGKADPRTTAQEGLTDLKILQGLLESGEGAGLIPKQVSAVL